MKAKLSLVLVIILTIFSDIPAQDSQMNESSKKRLKLELNSGLTYQLDHSINTGFDIRDFTTGYFEIGINYEFIDDFELGISLGTNKFNRIKHTHFQLVDISPPQDSIVGIPADNTFGDFEWAGVNLKYKFSDKWFTGMKVGFDRFEYNFLGMNLGYNIINSESWELNSIAQLFTRIDYSSFDINSYQVNFLFNVRYKIDVSGIEL